MSNYTKLTDFAVKDSLPISDPTKIITGTAHNDEYTAIEVAIATKADTTHSTTLKTTLDDADEVSITDSGAAYVGKRITWANVKTVLASTFTSLSLKDATGGYAGLTLFKINFKNAANTVTSFFTNSNTAARTYTFQDRDGTIADLTDIAGISTTTTKLPTITATVAGNALTIGMSSVYLDFRSATLTSGDVSTVLCAPSNLVISSGSTLGTVNAVASRLAVICMNNAGTAELAVVNISGGTNLNEEGVISTTAEGGAGAADSATVVYSTTARSNLAYRVVGLIESTQATAGTWVTAPSTIQGAGGNALAGIGKSPAFAKAWCKFNGTTVGTNAPIEGINVANVTRNSTGNYTVNFSTNLSTSTFAVFGFANTQGTTYFSSSSVSGVTVVTISSAGTPADYTNVFVLVFGS
jgi:hypothetical protein